MGPLANGAKKLYRDSKLGFVVSSAVTLAALGVVEWLGTIDFSTLPTFFSTVAALAVGQVSGLITAWAAKRGAPEPIGDALR